MAEQKKKTNLRVSRIGRIQNTIYITIDSVSIFAMIVSYVYTSVQQMHIVWD